MKWDQSLWVKYIEGKATKEDLLKLQEYLTENNHEDLFSLFKEQMNNKTFKISENISDQIWIQLLQKVKYRKTLNKRVPYKWTAIAASLIIFISTFLLVISNKNSNKGSVLAYQWDTIINSNHYARLVLLPDSTKIWLNHSAALLVNKKYTTERLVKLNGEAFFDVAKDGKAFTVESGLVKTKVLGTAFNIESRGEKMPVHISLLRGSVKLFSLTDTSTAVLSPGEMAVSSPEHPHFEKSALQLQNVAGWINGDLILNNISLREAFDKIALTYNIKIEVEEGLIQHQKIVASYRKNESWQKVLSNLLFIYHLTYKADSSGTVKITKK